MFRPTKLGANVTDLPIGETVSGDAYVYLFDKFGPWLSDSDQHLAVRDSLDSVHQEISTSYLDQRPSAQPSFALVKGSFLDSAKPTYVFNLKDEFFHLIINTLTAILSIHDKDTSSKFVIFTGNLDTNGYNPSTIERSRSLEFLSTVLNANSVRYQILQSELEEDTFLIYKARNIVLVNDFLTTSELSLGEISSLINKYVLDKLDMPQRGGNGRKLYVSRGSSAETDSAYLEPGNPSSGYKSNTDRLYSEPELEAYLRTKGFEIVKSSELGRIEDQVRLFNSASVLLGATGTGLTNLLFMQDGSTVIELRVEILWSTGDHDANNHYCYLSYGKGHTYMFVDASDKQATTAIAKLDKLFNALDLDAL